MKRNGEEVEFITPSLEVRTKMLDMIKKNRDKNMKEKNKSTD